MPDPSTVGLSFSNKAKTLLWYVNSIPEYVILYVEDRVRILSAHADFNRRVGLVAHVFGSIVDQVLKDTSAGGGGHHTHAEGFGRPLL